MELEEDLREYILKTCLQGESPNELQYDTDLIESGVLDSLALINLITYLEQTYNIKVESAEVKPENFKTVKALAQFINQKLTK